MKDVRTAYDNDSTSPKEWHKQPGEPQRRKWIIGVIIGMLALIVSPAVSPGNNDELLRSRKGERKPKVLLFPALGDVAGEELQEFHVRVSLSKIPQTPSSCLDNAYVMFTYCTMDQEGVRCKDVPVKISLAKFDGPPPKDQDNKIPTGKAIVENPLTGPPIEVSIEQVTEAEYKTFFDKLPAEKREEVKRGLGPGQHSICFEMRNPQVPEICLLVRIVHTAFIPAL